MDNPEREEGTLGPEDAGHQAIHDLLPDYAAVAALGRSPEEVYPAVAAHLRHCALCRATLDELLALLIPAYAGYIESSPACPPPDLSFLRPPTQATTAPARTSRLDEVGRFTIALSRALLRRPFPPLAAVCGWLLYR